MKRLTTYLKLAMVALIATVGMVACEDEPEVPQAPLAFFTFEADADNTELIQFTNETENGVSYVWDFGDGSATVTDENPSHEFIGGGVFTVKLTATNEGGDHVYQEDITVVKAAAVNLVVNGTFDEDSDWTWVNHWKSDNTVGSFAIAEGVGHFTQDGNWSNLGVYQKINLEVGTYAFDMEFSIDGIFEVWGNVYVGKSMPISGTVDADNDYDDGRLMVAYNAWDCGTDAYSGMAVEYGCTNNDFPNSDGMFEITEAGDYYLLFKTGGNTLGPNGVKIDNISIYKQ